MQLNKEEKITIISAAELNNGQQSQVLEALKANPKKRRQAVRDSVHC